MTKLSGPVAVFCISWGDFYPIVLAVQYESTIGRSGQEEQNKDFVGNRWQGAIMSIATEILGLRRDQFSSVERLIAALDWERAAPENTLLRRYAVTEAADVVLLNVAAHAADALSEPTTIRRNRRFFRFWRQPRRSNQGELHQRRFPGS